MKITYLHQYFNTPLMSGGTRSYEMAKRLVALGHEVNLVTTSRINNGHKGWFSTYESGIKVHWLSLPYSNHFTYRERIIAFLKFALAAGRKASTFQSDVIFATSTPLTIALPAFYASRRLGLPMVFEVRDLWPELPIAMGALKSPILCRAAKILEKFAYNSSKEVVALSPGMVDGVAATGFPPAHITEIPNGSDIDMFYPSHELRHSFRSEFGISEDKILIVYVGTFGRINDCSYMVRLAAALASDSRFHFLMIGDGFEHDLLLSESKKLGVLNQNLQILDPVSKQKVPRILAAADISTSLFLPLREMEVNSANKFFDGLSSGCCVAVNYGGWQARILRDYGAGLQMSRDVVLAAQQLQDFIRVPGRLKQAKMAARQLAVDQFARDELALRLENVLIRAIKND